MMGLTARIFDFAQSARVSADHSGRRLALLPGSFNNKSSARYQLLSKIFPQRIKEDILNKTMNRVIMSPFGGAFGLFQPMEVFLDLTAHWKLRMRP